MKTTAMGRTHGVGRWLMAGFALVAIGGPLGWAHGATPAAAVLIDGGRFGDLVTLGEHVDEVTARFGPLSAVPFAYPGFTVYLVQSTPSLVIAACDASGVVIHAELQQEGPDALLYGTASGIGLGASEPEVVAAYGEPEVRRPHFDGVQFLYPQLGLAFAFGGPEPRVNSIGIFLGVYMQCP